jgi:hypothetical protein
MMPSHAAAVLYAVVVGWNGSPSPEVPALRFADDDAAEYARLLRDAGAETTLLTRFDSDSAALHGDTRPDGAPTRDALFDALARVDRAIEASGRPGELFIVYTGHGDVDHGEGFVMLDGARLTRADLRDRVLAGRRAARIHVVVDACKSYYLVFARGGERRRHDAPFVDGRAAAMLPRVGFALSTSSDADSHEWEEVQGGVFSHEVRSALRGAADADGDGQVSYSELGAFVHTANQEIPNARFRPHFTVVPPADSVLGERTPLLGWSGAPATTRAVRLDAPGLGRISVEDSLGRRLLDAHLAPPGPLVHVPRAPLYVWDRGADREFALDGGGGDVALSGLAPRPRRLASRGAQSDAFNQLFARPFDGRSVDEWLRTPRDRLAPDGPPPDRRRIATVVTGVIAGAAGAAAIGCTLSALAIRDASASGSQQARADANASLDRLNGVAVGLYAGAGTAAVASAILGLWPRSKARIAPAPGPGGLGVSLVGTFR